MTPATTWKETIASDEDTRFEGLARRMAELQRINANERGPQRALHAKYHGVFEATLDIAPGLPDHARHGLFAAPGRYEALVRFSNGAGKVQHDKVGDVRGMSVKVLGVTGEKVLGNATTQDFLAILSSATPFRDPGEFVGVVWATRNPVLAPLRLIGTVGPTRAVALLRKLVAGLKGPNASLATRSFYSALPIQCGPYAVRYAFMPAATGAGEPLGGSADRYGEELAGRLRQGAIAYDLALQFYLDDQRTPIEDPTVDWDSPYITVGRLTITQQDASSERGKRIAERGERLSFDPWHALVAHRPLGAMMRARKHAYFASTQARAATPEPTSIAALVA
jgi:hypothetical protein